MRIYILLLISLNSLFVNCQEQEQDEEIIGVLPEVTPLTAEERAKIGLPITIPFFGQTEVKFTQEGLKAQLPAAGTKLNFGPLTINSGEVTLGEKNLVSYVSNAQFFGANVQIKGDIDTESSTFTLKLIPEQKLEFNMLNKKIAIDSGQIVFDKSKTNQINIKAQTNIFDQKVDLNFIIDKQTNTVDLQAQIDNIALKQIIPQAENTPIAQVPVSFTLTAKNFVFGQSKIILEGKADFSSVGVFENSQDLKNCTITGEYQAGSFSLIANLNKIDLPNIGVINRAKLNATYSKTEKQLYFEGQIDIFNIPMDSKLQIKRISGKTIFMAIVKAPKNYKLSQSIQAFKGQLFGDIALDNLYFILSNERFTDEESNITYEKGLNFNAQTTLTGKLEAVGSLTDSKGAPLTISGYLNISDPLASIFRANLPKGIPFEIKNVKFGPMQLEIQGKPTPRFFLLVNALVNVSGDNLSFNSRIGFAPPGAILSGTLIGSWSNPFGISGLKIGNTALQINFTLPPTLATTKVGITGSLCLSGTMAADSQSCLNFKGATQQTCAQEQSSLCGNGIGACVAVRLPDLLSGELNRLSLVDLVKFATKQLKTNYDLSKIPNYGVKCVKIYISPHTATIGEFKFEPGFNLTGKIEVLNSEAFFSGHLSGDGLFIHGLMSKIAIPSSGNLLVISGVNSEKPELKIELAVRNGIPIFLFFIDGEIKIANMFTQRSTINISPSGFNFEFDSSLGSEKYKVNGQPLLLAHIKGQSLTNPIDFNLEIIFKQYLINWILNQVGSKFQSAKNSINSSIDKAQKEVDKIDEINKQAQSKIKQIQDDVEKAKNSLISIDKAIARAQSFLNKIQESVNSIEAKIKNLDRALLNNVEYNIKKTAYETAHKIATKALSIAKQVTTSTLLTTRKAAASSLDIAKQFLAKVVNNITKGVLQTSSDAAKGSLEVIRKGTIGAIQGSHWVISTTIGSININEISYKGKLSALSSGQLGNVHVKGKIFQDFDLTTDINTKDIWNSLSKITQKVLDEFKDQILGKTKKIDQQLNQAIEIEKDLAVIKSKVSEIEKDKLSIQTQANRISQEVNEAEKEIKAEIAQVA